jgi:hypothetical protein
VQLADQIDQLLDATAQAIQLPDDQRVSRPRSFQAPWPSRGARLSCRLICPQRAFGTRPGSRPRCSSRF